MGPEPDDRSRKTSYRLFASYRENPRDPARWQAIVDHYSPWVSRWALRQVRDREVADEIVHEFFVKLFRSVGSLDLREGSLRPWVGTVVMNAVRDWRRKARGRREVAISDAILERTAWKRLEEDIDLADSVAAYRERYREAEQKLIRESRVGDSTRRAFFLLVKEGKSADEVQRSLDFKTPGYAVKCRNRVAAWLLEEMGLPAGEALSLLILEGVVRLYGTASEP